MLLLLLSLLAAPSPGGLSKDEIQGVVDPALPRVKYCYEKELFWAPSLRGTVTAKFVIAHDGTVKSTTTVPNKPHQTAMPSQAVVDCVLGVLKGLRFPAPKGGGDVNVTYPFVFEKRDYDPPPPPVEQQSGYSCNAVTLFGKLFGCGGT